jgi:ribosome-binding protein aMBF1 (putative translation factor)
MKQYKEARKYTSPVIQQALNNIPQRNFTTVERSMLIASRIDDVLTAKRWTQKLLADKMQKRPSEISKWLSGNHNFTLETIAQIESYLGIQLLAVPDNELIMA